MKKLFTLVAISLLISACGWHLRGSLNLPADLKSVAISGASATLYEQLERQLRASDIDLQASEKDAQYTIVIIDEANERRTAALGSDALAAEYELNATAEFVFRNSRGENVGEVNKVSVLRTLTYDSNQVLGSANEGSIIQREMTQEVANQIIRRMSFLSKLETAPAITNPDQADDGQTAP